MASVPLTLRGYSRWSARQWTRMVYRDWSASGETSVHQRIKAHRSGFTSRQYQDFGASVQGITPTASQRDLLYLSPFNRPSVWISNRVVAAKMLPQLRQHMATQLCTVAQGPGGLEVIRLIDYPADVDRSPTGLLELIARRGVVDILPVRWNRGLGRCLSFERGRYYIDGRPAAAEVVLETLGTMAQNQRCVLMSHRAPSSISGDLFGDGNAVIRFYVGKTDTSVRTVEALLLTHDTWRLPAPPQRSRQSVRYAQSQHREQDSSPPAAAGSAPLQWKVPRQRRFLGESRYGSSSPIDLDTGTVVGHDVVVPNFTELAGSIESMFSTDRIDFTLLTVDIVLSDGAERYWVTDVSSAPTYPEGSAFGSQATEFIAMQSARREEQHSQRSRIAAVGQKRSESLRRFVRRAQTFQLRSVGFTGRMARSWVNRVNSDRHGDDRYSAAQRRTAHAWGFMAATVDRFGITADNVDQFVSERDYSFVHPLNGKYGKWVRDRISTIEIFEPYADRFLLMHFHFLLRDGGLQVICLSEEAKRYGPTVEGVVAFLREAGPHTIASSAWNGSVELPVSVRGEEVIISDTPYSIDEFSELLRRRVRTQFLILSQHVGSAADEGDLELRIIMANRDGGSAHAVEAYRSVPLDIRPEVAVSAGQPVGQTAGVDDPEQVRQGNEAYVEAVKVTQVEVALEVEQDQEDHLSDQGRASPRDAIDSTSIEADDLEPSPAKTFDFISRIDLNTGEYCGARAFIGRQLYEFSFDPTTGDLFAGKVKEWKVLQHRLEELCHFVPQLEFVEFTVKLTDQGPKVIGILAQPPYLRHYPFGPEAVAFLRDRISRKRDHWSGADRRVSRWFHNLKLKVRKTFAAAIYPKGLVPYQSVRWIGDVGRDLVSRNGIPLKRKMWAYRNGFLSYRLPQYGITQHNHLQFISDFEYRWLRHINRKYRYWLEDKITIKYVTPQFNECFPQYYYYTRLVGEQNSIVAMMDCPKGYGATFDDILRLAREKGSLALKPDEGSHGEGFYHLEYRDEHFYLNGEESNEEQVLGVLADPDNQYLITEYIVMHPEVARLYPQSVNTVRMIVFKRDGRTPQIGNAFIRIGTSASGYVDNLAAGAMLAEIDIETGKFGNGQVLDRGLIREQPCHPDTGVMIEGTLPNWEHAKQKVLEIAAAIPQLEYFGFDLAITADGIKLPEINRFPDYPRIDRLTPETTEYLLYKLEQKKRLYGYDVRPPKTLFGLPKRKNEHTV